MSIVTVINQAAVVANNNFTQPPLATFDNTKTSTAPNSRYARCVLSVATWGGAPTAGTSMNLYALDKSSDGTGDGTGVPSGSTVNGGRLVGVFPLYATNEAQTRIIVISLLGVQYADFYIQNLSGQTATGIKLTVFPFSPYAL